MIKRRRRFKQTTSLKDRLAAFAREVREQASSVQSRVEREQLLRKARAADRSIAIEKWLSSPGLAPPA